MAKQENVMNLQLNQYKDLSEYGGYELKTGSVRKYVEFDGVMRELNIGWNLLGESSKPIVLVLGGISANRNVAYDGLIENIGWWENFVGKNKTIDTDKYSVLSLDYLGAYKTTDFISKQSSDLRVSTYEQAKVIKCLISELGINRLHSIVGSSYGGMVSLAFSELFPTSLKSQIIISACDKSHPRSSALRQIQRSIVRFGLENGNVESGLSLARQLGMVTYRTKIEFSERYGSGQHNCSQQSLQNYLSFNGDKFAKCFNYKAFLCLSESIDSHQINPQSISTPTQFIAVDSDELIFKEQIQKLARSINNKPSLTVISSSYGHDAFLKENRLLKPIIQSALEAEYD